MKENYKSILWFKNDLRLLDNEALVEAVSQSTEILPVYVFDPRNWEKTDYAFAKAGFNRFTFLCQTLENLRTNLQALGSNLLIKIGAPEVVILDLIEEFHIQKVFAEQEYAPEELRVIDTLKRAVQPAVAFKFMWGKTLYHKDDIPYKIEDIPLTSKAYRINTTKNTAVRAELEVPAKIATVKLTNWGVIPENTQLGIIINSNYVESPYVQGGEDKALERLEYYTTISELLTSYKWTRNRSLGMDYSSKLSPYLAVGAISPRTIYHKVKEYELTVKKNSSTWWLVFEVVWRDFFTFKGMRMGSAIFKTEGYRNKEFQYENDQQLFKKWCDGNTGIPFIDAHIRQLNQTGYMSNRGRVNCASYFVHDLKIDWTWGAAYFESKLIDYDVSANWMNWHVQAYEIWYTNPVNQSIKYKAAGYINKWIPELSHIENEFIYAPWLMATPPDNYAQPIAIYSKWSRALNKIEKAALEGVEAGK